MNREDILDILLNRLGAGAWILAVLRKEGRPINKEKLGIMTNQLYQMAKQKHNDPNALPADDLIGSRHTLDQLTARLEGAGLVDIPDMPGRATFYSLSALGVELIKYRESKN